MSRGAYHNPLTVFHFFWKHLHQPPPPRFLASHRDTAQGDRVRDALPPGGGREQRARRDHRTAEMGVFGLISLRTCSVCGRSSSRMRDDTRRGGKRSCLQEGELANWSNQLLAATRLHCSAGRASVRDRRAAGAVTRWSAAVARENLLITRPA